jgi:hypothetical protein
MHKRHLRRHSRHRLSPRHANTPHGTSDPLRAERKSGVPAERSSHIFDRGSRHGGNGEGMNFLEQGMQAPVDGR